MMCAFLNRETRKINFTRQFTKNLKFLAFTLLFFSLIKKAVINNSSHNYRKWENTPHTALTNKDQPGVMAFDSGHIKQ